MSRTKEKKIEKIKNRKIWPYVVAIVVVVLLFTTMSSIFLAISASNLVTGKLKVVYETSNTIKNDYLRCQETGEDFSELCSLTYKYTPDVLSVCITDSDLNIVEQYGEIVPNREYIIGNGFLNNLEETNDTLVIDERGMETLEDEAVANYWYIEKLPDSDKLLCVRVNMHFYMIEIEVFGVAIILFLITMLLLVGWNIFMIVRVVRERKRDREILYTSTITGGENIQHFKDKAQALLKANKRRKTSYALISLRLLKYNNFCSCYGVEEGEDLLEALFKEIRKRLGKKETAAHSARADFVLLLAYTSDDELQNRLLQLSEELKSLRTDQKLNFGMGIYKIPDNPEDVNTMCSYAEVTQNSIPEDSDNHIKYFDETMLETQRWIRKVEDDMERALAEHEFQVYLQPKYSTKEEKVSGAEALVRWIHPTEGFIPPNKFIPILEGNGSILKLDDYMLNEVARLQAQWLSEGKTLVPISVNVSRAHFTKEDLAEHICATVDKYKVPHDMIELELTESAFFDDKNVLINTVKKLKSYGFEISMDDFGAGYSSLNSLKELPLDVLKLDAEFFRGDDSEGRGDLIVGESITLAKKLNMRIVAEGIETREQVDSLAEKDCDLIQGYYFAKPMPVNEFEKLAFTQ